MNHGRTAAVTRVLSPGVLNRSLLARQLLLERSSLPLRRVLERVGGLQTQYAPSGYIALWSRTSGFRRSTLTRALQDRRVVQATMMRATIHMATAADYGLFTAGVRRSRREWWERVHRSQLGGVDVAAAAEHVRRDLAHGPRRQPDLVASLVAAGFPKVVWSGVGEHVDLVRVPPQGTWERRRADLYALASAEVGDLPDDEAAGLRHLITRYLGAFGPAPLAAAAGWAGVPVTLLRTAAEQMRLRTFADVEGNELLDVPRGVLPEGDVPVPVRFLPTWDALLLAHARHASVLPERFRSEIFNPKMPQSIPTFLVNGSVAGTWKHVDGRVQVRTFEPLPARLRRAVEAEASALQAWLNGPD